MAFQPERENKQDLPGQGSAARKGEGSGGWEEGSLGQAKPRVWKRLNSIQGLRGPGVTEASGRDGRGRGRGVGVRTQGTSNCSPEPELEDEVRVPAGLGAGQRPGLTKNVPKGRRSKPQPRDAPGEASEPNNRDPSHTGTGPRTPPCSAE